MNPLDLRNWLAEIEQLGELKHVRGADWNLELGAISELNVKKDLPPALLFDEIKGYPQGFRVLTCSTSSPARLSSILRLPIQRTHHGLVEALRGKPAQWQAAAAKFTMMVVKTGPALEQLAYQTHINPFASILLHHPDCHVRRPPSSCARATTSRTTSAPRDRSASSTATTLARPAKRRW